MSETQETPKTVRKRVRPERPITIHTEPVSKAFPVLRAQESRQHADEFTAFYSRAGSMGERTIIEPMYPPNQLIRHSMSSGVLRTCIEAMATNVEGFGYTLEYIGPEESRESDEVTAEYDRVRGILDHPNGEYSLIELRRRFRYDKETTGYGTMEIIRNPEDGFPDMLLHIPSFTVRATTQDSQATKARRFMPRPGAREDNMMEVRTRFRRYVQIIGGVPTYFRENGDTRAIDYTTGHAVGGDSGMPDKADKLASDILMDHIYYPGSRYGAPRWIGDLRSVLGIQESENMNLSFFKDNGIPAMMMFLLGGALSGDGARRFEEGIRQNRGAPMMHKISILEVEGNADAASEDGAIQRPDIKTVPLLQDRQTDAFFQEYETNSSKKLRSSFRIPALFTGLSEDVRHAVADASMTVAENQVFGPERASVDDLFNYSILTYNGMPMRFWRFRSNPPRITSAQEVMAAIRTFDAVGAMTPNIAISMANEMFDMQIPVIEDGWGDEPFAFTRAPATPPGQPTPPNDQPPLDAAGKAVKAAVAARGVTTGKPIPRRRVRVLEHRDVSRKDATTLRTIPEGSRRPSRVLTDGPSGSAGYEAGMEDTSNG